MRLPASNLFSKLRRENAAVLIIVLWIAIGLISIALYFANSMTYELRASDNRASGVETGQAIEGAARYVSYALYNYSTNGAVPSNTQFSCAAMPIGDAHVWLIGRDPSETPSSDPYFGLVDEGSKLNLNTASTNALMDLPNMTVDFAQAIVDWRSTNSDGLYSMDYTALGYEDKNAPFETVDELRLVYGATMDLLVGNDLNLNGILDGNEQGGTGGTQVEPGLFEYCTVYSKEPNFNTDDVLLTNVNTAILSDLQNVLDQANVSTSYAQRIHGYVQPPTGTARTFTGLFDFCAYCRSLGMSADDFTKLMPYITTSTSTYIRGRVNIDTADIAVMTALFEGAGGNSSIDQSTAESAAETIVNYRQQNSDNLNSVAWVVDALGSTSPVVTALRRGDYITSRSYQFSADIAAVGPYGRGYRRVKFIFDTSSGTPKIIYRRDLSGLGWALGDKVRQTWVANATQ